METTNNSSLTQEISRPWQGTILGVLNIIGLVIIGIALSLFIIDEVALLPGMAEKFGVSIANMFFRVVFILFIPLLFFILGIFVTRGIFKGQKWAIIVTIIFTVLALLFALFDFKILSIIVGVFFLYAGIICFKSPFYNKK